MSDREFENVGGRTVYDGRILQLRLERFRFADGEEAERELVRAPGAVGVVAVDDEHLWLVRQPRESVADPDYLEIPAGRLDKEGEAPLESAKRELAEEIGMLAGRWEHLKTYHSTVGMTDEAVHLFLAQDLRDSPDEHDSGENERIEIVRWPLSDLDRLLDETTDSKTLIGVLLLLRRRAV